MADVTDPEKMTDDQLEEAINPKPEGEEQNPELNPEQPETPEDPEEQDNNDDGEGESEEEEPKPSRREQLRIHQLLEKYGSPEAPKPRKVDNTLDYQNELEADDETVKRLNDDREEYGRRLYEQGLEQAKSIRFHTRLEIDAPRVETKYPQLDKNNKEEFNPALATSINSMYLSAVGFDPKTDTVQNPDIRYADYVESMFELADEMANRKVEQSRTNITKQAATTSLRPDGSSPKRLNLNKAPEQMTDEELDAIISQAIPNKR